MTRALALNLTVAAVLLAILGFVVSTLPTRAAQCSGTVGSASFYAEAHHGRTTASGEPFNMHAMTAAMWGPAFGTRYRVTHGKRSVVVTINDRGPARRLNRVIDLSKAAFAKLAPTSRGVITVCLERL